MANINIGAAISAAASGAALEAAKAAEAAKADEAKKMAEAAAEAAKKAEAVASLNGSIAICESEIARCTGANTDLRKDIEELENAQRYFRDLQSSFDSSVQSSINRFFNLSSIADVAGAVFSGAFFSNKSDDLFRGPACRQAQQAIENALAKIKTKMDQLQEEIDVNSKLISSLAQKQTEYQSQLAAIQAE